MIYRGRKLMLVFLLVIYLSVSMNFALVYTAHLLHHVITNTLHQHHHHDHDHYDMHSHFMDDHHHHHSHSHAIDHAIREVKQEREHDEAPAAPSPGLEIKFAVHHLPRNNATFRDYPIYKDIVNPYIVNYKSPIISFPTPPPERPAYI